MPKPNKTIDAGPQNNKNAINPPKGPPVTNVPIAIINYVEVGPGMLYAMANNSVNFWLLIQFSSSTNLALNIPM